MKRRWLVGILVAVMIAATVGGVVAADGDDPAPADESTPAATAGSDLLDRVAEKLGVDPATLEDAYRQAAQELQAQRLQAWLDSLVADGTLTEEQAAEIEAWLAARPAALDLIPRGRGGCFGFFGGKGHGRGFGGFFGPDRGFKHHRFQLPPVEQQQQSAPTVAPLAEPL